MVNPVKNIPEISYVNEKEVSVWDPFVRIFHWALVAAFVIAYLTEDDFLTIHTWAGYSIAGLLMFRIVWGLIGTKHARFTDFVFAPREVVKFLKDTFSLRAKRYLGHNPAGGAMVILLMCSLIITVCSGLITLGLEEGEGPFASLLVNWSYFWGEWFEEIHEFFANFTLFLVFVHIAGVVVESLIHRENLITAMLNGKKRPNRSQE